MRDFIFVMDQRGSLIYVSPPASRLEAQHFS